MHLPPTLFWLLCPSLPAYPMVTRCSQHTPAPSTCLISRPVPKRPTLSLAWYHICTLHHHHVQCRMHGNLHQDQLNHHLPRPNHHLRQQVHPHRLVDGAPHNKSRGPSRKSTNPGPLTTPPTAALAANVDATSSAAEYARYIHQIMCSPPASALLRALDLSEELATILGLTTVLIKNHLPRSTATNKGHMRQH
jgi:hypothetical protein